MCIRSFVSWTPGHRKVDIFNGFIMRSTLTYGRRYFFGLSINHKYHNNKVNNDKVDSNKADNNSLDNKKFDNN